MNELWNEHKDFVRWLSERYGGNEEDSYSISCLAFCKACQSFKFGKFRPHLENAVRWEFIRLWQYRAREKRNVPTYQLTGEVPVQKFSFEPDFFDTLTANQAKIIQDSFFGGYGTKEIAEAKGVVEATISHTKRTALRKLRRYFDER